MFDQCADRLLEKEERFAARGGHRFVEIWDRSDGRHAMYQSGELKEKEIVSWVDEARFASGPINSGLRVLLSPKPSGSPSSGKLPFSKSTYHSLSRAWRIPSTFIRAISQKLSIVTQCSVAPHHPPRSSQPCPSHPDHFNEEEYSTISDEAQCLLVRGDIDWTWDYTLCSIFDSATSTTYVLIVGLTAVEIDLVQSYLASLASKSASNLTTHPLLLPTILLDLATDDTASLLKLRGRLLGEIQQRTGMDRFNSLKNHPAGKEKERKELDLDDVMLRLTCLSDWVAAQRGFVGLQKRVVGVVEEMLKADSDESTDISVITMFQERLDFARESLLAAEQKCQYLERSIGAQVQTIYSLIGQKDNRLNIAAASSSCQIASDSRRIAILTRRDSTDMRIIAAVTLIFLPGTFVATVFSTGMFNWDNGDDSTTDGVKGKTVSGYIWVYFMLTGILTFVVLIAWALFSWVQNRKMLRQFTLDPEQGDGWGLDGKRKDTELTLVGGKQGVGRRTWALREFELWKEEARGPLRWWGRGKKSRNNGEVVEELKSA